MRLSLLCLALTLPCLLGACSKQPEATKPLAKLGLLQPLNMGQIPNAKNVIC